MRKFTFRLFSLALLTLTFALLQAQAKSDFSGTWKANIGKSDFGPAPPPDSLVSKIVHEDPSTLKWEGDDLVADTKGSWDGNDFTAKDRYTLSDGGKTMTIQRHISTGMGEFDMKLVFEKQ